MSEESEKTELTQADIDKAVSEAVSGLKNKNSELLDSLAKSKESLKQWEGLDAGNVRSVLDKIQSDEELKLLSEGRHDEAFKKRLEKVNAQHASQLENITKERDAATAALEKAREQVRNLVIDQQALSAFMAEKGIESAGPDVIARAKNTFSIEEDGSPVARNNNGEIIRGKDGPITVLEWVQNLKTTAPHLFPGSTGAGAGNQGNSSGQTDMATKLDEAAKSGNMAEFIRLRKAGAK